MSNLSSNDKVKQSLQIIKLMIAFCDFTMKFYLINRFKRLRPGSF